MSRQPESETIGLKLNLDLLPVVIEQSVVDGEKIVKHADSAYDATTSMDCNPHQDRSDGVIEQSEHEDAASDTDRVSTAAADSPDSLHSTTYSTTRFLKAEDDVKPVLMPKATTGSTSSPVLVRNRSDSYFTSPELSYDDERQRTAGHDQSMVASVCQATITTKPSIKTRDNVPEHGHLVEGIEPAKTDIRSASEPAIRRATRLTGGLRGVPDRREFVIVDNTQFECVQNPEVCSSTTQWISSCPLVCAKVRDEVHNKDPTPSITFSDTLETGGRAEIEFKLSASYRSSLQVNQSSIQVNQYSNEITASTSSKGDFEQPFEWSGGYPVSAINPSNPVSPGSVCYSDSPSIQESLPHIHPVRSMETHLSAIHSTTSTSQRLGDAQALLEEFHQAISTLSLERRGTHDLNTVEMQLMRHFDAFANLCRDRLEMICEVPPASDVIVKNTSIPSDVTHDEGSLISVMLSDVTKVVSNADKFREMYARAERLTKLLVATVATDQSEEWRGTPTCDESVFAGEMIEARMASNVQPDVETDELVRQLHLDRDETHVAYIQPDQTDLDTLQLKAKRSDMLVRCLSFEKKLDRLKELVSAVPEPNESQGVEKARGSRSNVRAKLNDVTECSIFSKFMSLHGELKLVLSTLLEASDQIEVPPGREIGEDCIHRKLREAQMVFENALAKSQAVFDVIKFGRDKGAFVPSNLMNNIMKATKEARTTNKHIEAIFQQKLRALKKALQSAGVDMMAYGDFNLIEWKTNFLAHLQQDSIRPTDFFRSYTKDSAMTRRSFVKGIQTCKFTSSLEDIYCVYDLMDTNCTNQVSLQEFIGALFTKKTQNDVSASDEEKIRRFLDEQLSACSCSTLLSIEHVGCGVYEFGERRKRYFIRVFDNGGVLIRVGSGWESLSNFIRKIDPCRQCRANKQEAPVTKPGLLKAGLVRRRNDGTTSCNDHSSASTSSVKCERKRAGTYGIHKLGAEMQTKLHPTKLVMGENGTMYFK